MMKFIIDCMLGKLARKLRMLGYDTKYFQKIEDSELVWLSKNENRILITRDTMLVKRFHSYSIILLTSQNTDEQVKELKQILPAMSPAKSFTRCIECNSELVSCIKEDVQNKIPLYVFETCNIFLCCPHCKRIYWKATHGENMEKEIEQWF